MEFLEEVKDVCSFNFPGFLSTLCGPQCSYFCGLQFKPEEIAAIMNDFNEPGTLAPTGLYLGGSKYMVIQGEPGAVIRGKKVIKYFMKMF